MTTEKNSAVVRHEGMPPSMPAIAVTMPSSTDGQRAPAGYTSHTATKKMMAFAIAQPLKTAIPTRGGVVGRERDHDRCERGEDGARELHVTHLESARSRR